MAKNNSLNLMWIEEMLHGTNYGGLGLKAREAGKASLLCKWIVKAMEHGESNLQLMVKYKLAMLIPKEVEVKGINPNLATPRLL